MLFIFSIYITCSVYIMIVINRNTYEIIIIKDIIVLFSLDKHLLKC